MGRIHFAPCRSNVGVPAVRYAQWGGCHHGVLTVEKKRKEQRKSPMEKAMAMTDLSNCKTDPSGSYTGQPEDPREKPVQDADDL